MSTKKHIIDIPDAHKVGVYAIRNKRNNKYYVGSSVNVYDRMETHRRNIEKLRPVNLEFAKDLKSATDVFDFEFLVLETFDDLKITKSELRKKELEYIQKYNAFQNGYNMSNHFPSLTGRYGKDELLTSEKSTRKEWVERFQQMPDETLLLMYGLDYHIASSTKDNLIAIEVMRQEILKRMKR